MTFTTTLNSGEIIKIPISVVLNLLDYSKIKIISPGSLTAQLESHKIDLRDPKDKIYMHLPPHYLEWFNFTCTDAKVTLNKGRLVVPSMCAKAPKMQACSGTSTLIECPES